MDVENCIAKFRNRNKDEGPRHRVLPAVVDDILKDAEEILHKHGDLTDDALLKLYSFFGSPFEKALELLEKNCVVRLRSKEGRYILQVTGSSGELYTLFPSINYCHCAAYRYQVIGSRSFLSCKHVLAARLAEMMGKVRELPIGGMPFIKVLCAAAGIIKDEPMLKAK